VLNTYLEGIDPLQTSNPSTASLPQQLVVQLLRQGFSEEVYRQPVVNILKETRPVDCKPSTTVGSCNLDKGFQKRFVVNQLST